MTNGSPLAALERHCVGTLPSPLFPRRQTYAETLNNLASRPDPDIRINILLRTTWYFQSDTALLERRCKELAKSSDLTKVELAHQASDVGMPYELVARDRHGRVLHYDGLTYRISEEVHPEPFGLEELEKLAGYPPADYDVV